MDEDMLISLIILMVQLTLVSIFGIILWIAAGPLFTFFIFAVIIGTTLLIAKSDGVI